MTRDDFVQEYCARSGVPWEKLVDRRTAISCDCGDALCKGWQMVPKDPPEPAEPLTIEMTDNGDGTVTFDWPLDEASQLQRGG